MEIIESITKKPRSKKSGRNSIQRFGTATAYKNDIISETIPEFLDKLSNKICQMGLLSMKPTSITINEYYENQYIDPHIDNKECGEIITILSILSQATMFFEKKQDKFGIELPRRSLIQMRDDIRNNWMHSIAPVKNQRYSIVFRCGN